MPDSDAGPRTPPHDVRAEMGVLGSMFLSEDAVHLARERLSESSFYKLAHQDIFKAVLELSDAYNTVDFILLRDELSKQDKLEKVGGESYLLELMEAVPTSANAEYYIEIVREHALRRHLIQTASHIERNAYLGSQDVDDLLDEAEARVLAVRHEKDTSRSRNVQDVLQSVMQKIEERHQHETLVTGLATGFYDLDRLTSGFQPGELIVVAARPSIGKTSLALNILDNVCVHNRRAAAMYTLETSAEQIVSNFLCIHNKLDTAKFRRGALDDDEWQRLEASIDDLVGLEFYIDDSPTLRISELRARARRMVQRHQVELIVVDYLQLMTANRPHDSRAADVAQISQGLKALARELGIPVLAVAQLSRRVEQEHRTPRLSDLRESGAIEQDADVVLLMHRAVREGARQGSGEGWESPDGTQEIYGPEADVIIAKQRNGPTGVVRLVFRSQYLRFESRAATTTTTPGR